MLTALQMQKRVGTIRYTKKLGTSGVFHGCCTQSRHALRKYSFVIYCLQCCYRMLNRSNNERHSTLDLDTWITSAGG